MASPAGRPLRVGVVGTGFGSLVHVPAFVAAPDFEVVAVVSGQAANAARVAAEAGIGWSSDDYQAMLREVDLDVVSLAVPGHLHHDMVLAAAAAGKHILCEKPFATSLAEGQEMVDAVRRAGVGHAINHEFRMIPARRELKRLVDAGFLGTVYDIRGLIDLPMLLGSRGWSWWSDRAQYGGLMQAMTSHMIDFLLWTFGDMTRLTASVDTFIRQRPLPDGTLREVTSDDQNAALVHFASGATGLIRASGISRITRQLIEAHGSAGSLSLDGTRLAAGREPGKLDAVEVAPLPPLSRDDRVTLMASYLRPVASVFRGEMDATVATFEQGLRVQAVMDAMHASADSGGNSVAIQEPAGTTRAPRT